jgi:nitrate/nitrite transporter NarK
MIEFHCALYGRDPDFRHLRWAVVGLDHAGILRSPRTLRVAVDVPPRGNASHSGRSSIHFFLDSNIREAAWLTEAEKELLKRNIRLDQPAISNPPSLSSLFADRRVWLMCFIYFCCVMGQYGITFWLPTLINAVDAKSTLQVGLLSVIPYSFTIVTMVLVGRSADWNRERRWHLAIPMALGAIGLLASTLAGERMWLAITCLTLASSGIITSAPLFWSLPTSFLTGVTAAAGIAAINSVGNLAGFVSPFVIGRLKDLTHESATGMYLLAAVLLAGAITVLSLPKKLVNR